MRTGRTSVTGVVFAIAVASLFSAGRAEARPARAPAGRPGLNAAWPKEARHAEAAFVADINRLRASRGLPLLRTRPNLTGKARRWATDMAAARAIRHSELSVGITGGWHRIGENVGKGSSEPRLHAAFVASPTHLQNLVDPGFRYVGVGVVAADGILFVSQVFMQPPSSTPSRRPARAAFRAAKRAAPARQLPPAPHRSRSSTGTPGFSFRTMH